LKNKSNIIDLSDCNKIVVSKIILSVMGYFESKGKKVTLKKKTQKTHKILTVQKAT